MKIFNQNIDLNLYKVFYAVAESKSFSKASEQLYLSQPAVSHSINKLEEQLKIKLFYRTPKGVILTPEAEELFVYIKNAYNYIYLGEQHIKDSKEMMCGNIRIGVPTHIGSFFLIDKIQTFHEKYPNIIFSIQSRSTADMLRMLEAHKLDFIIDSSPINKNGNMDLVTKKILNVNTIFVAKKSSKNNLINITKENIEKIPLILPNNNTATRKILDEQFRKMNLKLNPVMEISTTEMTLNMVKKEIGVGWIIKNILDDELKKEICEINADFELPEIEIELGYIDQFLSYAAKKFIEEKVE